ncbi:right-handed parallel beta-helix repeat-containing protein [Methylomonas sp. 2BW1-5-20]|uniref:right-handed parallel beta-helix repeat-containing protein n=1 Tax=Methylomonas sp. 2BW1-5-20 TaxID=3376686 RepID=UPI00404D0503
MAHKLTLFLASFFFCSTAMALDIYVSPTGSDTKLDGSSATINAAAKTGPFKSLAKAQQFIRDLKTAGKFTQPITVHVGKGTYQLKAALEFNDSDSGESGKEILWQGEKGTTLITGGVQLAGCQAYDAANPEQILSCPLDPTLATAIKGETDERVKGNAPAFEVFLNDYRLHPARWPDYDWAHIRTELTPKIKFSVYEKMPTLTGDLSDAQVHIFPGNDYLDQYIGISLLDQTNNQISLANPTATAIADGRRFYLQNIQSALNSQGEWFYDQTNSQLLFIPPYDTIPKSIVISTVQNLIKLDSASHIEISNLTFRHSSGHAITISKSDAISLDNLEINNVGGQAIYARNNTNTSISNSKLHDSGQGGIYLSGGNRPTLQASGNSIYNNTIYDYDTNLLMAPAVDLDGVAINVLHNLIALGQGGGIRFNGNDHIFEKNEIYSVCQNSNDCGAIYSGRDWTYRGNVIQYNYIHDMYGYGLAQVDISKNLIQYTYEGARGIYLDDGISGTNVIGNILVNAGTNSIQLGNGRDTRIENNIIKTNKKALWVAMYSPYYNWDWNRASLTTMPITNSLWQSKYPALAKPMSHDTWPEGNTIQRNVIISTAYLGYSLRYQLPKESNLVGNNIVWHASSAIRTDYRIPDTTATKGGALWSDWVNQGIETTSINADPCISITGSKVKLTCANSPINQLGIKGIPADIGLIK